MVWAQESFFKSLRRNCINALRVGAKKCAEVAEKVGVAC